MFHPMVFAVIAALVGALVFSLTFLPAACALLLTGKIQEKDNFMVRGVKRVYVPMLKRIVSLRWAVVGIAAALVVACGFLVSRMGTEFIPTLDEGDIAMGAIRPPGTGVEQAVRMQKHA